METWLSPFLALASRPPARWRFCRGAKARLHHRRYYESLTSSLQTDSQRRRRLPFRTLWRVPHAGRGLSGTIARKLREVTVAPVMVGRAEAATPLSRAETDVEHARQPSRRVRTQRLKKLRAILSGGDNTFWNFKDWYREV
jgi:hypothetical protein